MFKSGNQYNMRVAVECVTINPEIKKKRFKKYKNEINTFYLVVKLPLTM